MALTNEKMEKLSNYLMAETDRAKALLKLTPEEAVEKINADGNDFTVDELNAFGSKLQAAVQAQSENGELSESNLEDVAGGIGLITGTLIALGAGVVVGAMDKFKIW